MASIDFNEKGKIVVICNPGLSFRLCEELDGLGYVPLEQKETSVHIKGSMNDAIKLNLYLRSALYVHYLLKQFKCKDSDELYRQCSKIAWEDIIPENEYISIISRVDNDTINNSMYPGLKVKDAVADRMLNKTNKRPDSGPERDNIVLNLYWNGDDCWLYLNTSGRKLSDRNYRKMPFAAPLQETLASAIIAETGYDGSCPLVLPMCGSGTLAVEAAFIALNRANGLLRSQYCFTHIKGYESDYYNEIKAEIRKNTKKGIECRIIATDIHFKAIEAAKNNAMTAGVDHLIDFDVCDFAETVLPEQKGIIVMNPEYGERMGEVQSLEKLYKRIGDFFKQKCQGYMGYIFTGNMQLAKKVGLRAKRRIPFFNATIECRLLEYEMYEGTKKHKPQKDSKD